MESILLFAALLLGTYHALRGLEHSATANSLSAIQQQLLADPHLDIEQCVYRILVKEQKTRPVLVCHGKLQRLPFTLHIWHTERTRHIDLAFHPSLHLDRLGATRDHTFSLELDQRTLDGPVTWDVQGDCIRYVQGLTREGRDRKISSIFKHITDKSGARCAHLEVRSPHDIRWTARCDIHHEVTWSNILEYLALVRHHVPTLSVEPVSSQQLCLMLSKCGRGLAPLILELYLARASTHDELLDTLLHTPFEAPHHALLAYVRAHDHLSSLPQGAKGRPSAQEMHALEAALFGVATQMAERDPSHIHWPNAPVAHLTALRILLDTPAADLDRACFWFVRTTAATHLPEHAPQTRTAWLVERHDTASAQDASHLAERLAPAILTLEELLTILDTLEASNASRWEPFVQALTLPAEEIERGAVSMLSAMLQQATRTPQHVEPERALLLTFAIQTHGQGASLHTLREVVTRHKRQLSPPLREALDVALRLLEARARKGALTPTSPALRGNLSILSSTP